MKFVKNKQISLYKWLEGRIFLVFDRKLPQFIEKMK